jgi:uncharacterized NAD(P)/FAD-binding protein YdhS
MTGTRRVLVVGGGASGTLAAVQLLRGGGTGLEVVVIEPREVVGHGIAYGTRDPWHRLNVPAQVMSGLPDHPEHFQAWAGVPPASFPDRMTYGRYLEWLLAATNAESEASFRHLRDRATGLVVEDDELRVSTAGGDTVAADAVVIATGNELPPVPAPLASLEGDPRFVRDPWAAGALEPVADGETVAILGTGHTAIDLSASVLVARPAARVIAISRHGELPRVHEDPWRPRQSTPVFDVEEFRAFHDPLEEAAARIRAHPGGWRQGLDSLRPITPALWATLDEPVRHSFVRDWRRTWEIHRSRVPVESMREVGRWRRGGRLVVRSGTLERVVADRSGLWIDAGGAPIHADRLLLATGPDERAAANPFLAAAIDAGVLRPGPLGLGLDADVDTLRAIDGTGGTGRPVHVMGPLLRGVLWETIAVPEIRAQAARIATSLLADG